MPTGGDVQDADAPGLGSSGERTASAPAGREPPDNDKATRQTPIPRPRGRHAAGVYLFLVLVGLGVALAHYRVGPGGPGTREAVVRVGVGEDLLLGRTRGRQGLVGSLRWAPLPTPKSER